MINPLGIKGVGESGAIPGAAAIANAVETRLPTSARSFARCRHAVAPVRASSSLAASATPSVPCAVAASAGSDTRSPRLFVRFDWQRLCALETPPQRPKSVRRRARRCRVGQIAALGDHRRQLQRIRSRRFAHQEAAARRSSLRPIPRRSARSVHRPAGSVPSPGRDRSAPRCGREPSGAAWRSASSSGSRCRSGRTRACGSCSSSLLTAVGTVWWRACGAPVCRGGAGSDSRTSCDPTIMWGLASPHTRSLPHRLREECGSPGAATTARPPHVADIEPALRREGAPRPDALQPWRVSAARASLIRAFSGRARRARHRRRVQSHHSDEQGRARPKTIHGACCRYPRPALIMLPQDACGGWMPSPRNRAMPRREWRRPRSARPGR